MVDEQHLLPLLTMVSGPLQGVSFRLRAGRHTIGRGDGVDIPLEDIKTSRRHASVELVDGRAILTDLGSTNGTWVNGHRIDRPVELSDGDRLRIGHVDIRYFDPSSASTDPVNTPIYRLVGGEKPAPRPLSAALAAPTQGMTATRRRSTRVALLIGGGAVLVGWAAWLWRFLG